MGSSKDHFLDFRVLLPGSQKYFREYLCENENIFKNILGYCSRAQVLLIYAKISCYSPFKLSKILEKHTNCQIRKNTCGKICEPRHAGIGGGIASTVVAVMSIVSSNFKEPCYVSSFRPTSHMLTPNATFFY